jgi:predicted transcriptional regulator
VTSPESGIPQAVSEFVRATIKSVWALELLLLLRKQSSTAFTVEQLTRELRGSRTVVNDALAQLQIAGLVTDEDGSQYRYRYPSESINQLVAQLEHIYAERPTALIKEIASSPSSKIQSFADAFKFRKD